MWWVFWLIYIYIICCFLLLRFSWITGKSVSVKVWDGQSLTASGLAPEKFLGIAEIPKILNNVGQRNGGLKVDGDKVE